MVKNTIGGSGHKKQASKYAGGGGESKVALKLRISESPYELYAQVTSLLGNSMCHVVCQDDKVRLCFIRGKFRGRGKRDNTLTIGKWILVGIRDYETAKKDKLENCDLLDIYSDLDKDRLQSKVTDVNWHTFLKNDSINSHTEALFGGVKFTDEREEEYNTLIETAATASGPSLTISSPIALTATMATPVANKEYDLEVDFDDI